MNRNVMVTEGKHQPNWPPVTIVVPAYNSVATIGRCVQSLLQQNYPYDLTRIIIVDNNSTDGTRAELLRHEGHIDLLDEPTRGPSAARNAGIMAADTELIAFTDADCIVDPSWLGELVKISINQPMAGFIGGRIDSFQAQTPVQYYFASHFDQKAAIANPAVPSVITANMLARRSDLIRIGLFDETFLRGEDVDLSFRAAFDYGVTFAYADLAIVYHINIKTLGALFAKGMQHGVSLYHNLGKHSEKIGLTRRQRLLRRRTYHGILKELWRAFGLGLIIANNDEPITERQRALFQATFDLGRQVGLLRAMLTPSVAWRSWAKKW